jgi:hypothetical protein
VFSLFALFALAAITLAQASPTPSPTPTPHSSAAGIDEAATDVTGPSSRASEIGGHSSLDFEHERPRIAVNRVNVCGSITGETTWSAENVYVIDGCTVTVESGATLRIEPGTVVKLWYWDWRLRVRGTLLSEGAAEAPVWFVSLRDDSRGGDTNGDGAATQPAPGDWGLVSFESGAVGRLRHTYIAHGGWFSGFGLRAAIEADANAELELDGVYISQSARGGVRSKAAALTVRRSSFTTRDDALQIEGLTPWRPLEISDSDFTTTRAGQAAAHIWLGDHPSLLVFERNRAAGLGWNGFVLDGDVLRDLELRSRDSVPLLDDTTMTVHAGANLRIAGGAVFKFHNWDWRVRVYGGLYVDGTDSEPVVFTSLRDDAIAGDTNGDGAATTAGPGQWGLISFEAGSEGRLAHTELRYGGLFSGFGLRGMLEAHGTDDVVLQNVTLRNAAIDGIFVSDASMIVRGAVFDNPTGIRNGTPSRGLVDARRVWWGEASGPRHPRTNPNGLGNPVSDGVSFFPWADDVSGHVPSRIVVEGPDRVSPGDTVDVALRYFVEAPLVGAILVASLPWNAELIDATANGLYWPERHQVLWKLGDLQPIESSVSLRLRYEFGLPNGSKDAVFASLAAENAASPDIDLSEYAEYTPRIATGQVVLSPDELASELAGSAALRRLYDRARADGFLVPRATRTSTASGEEVLEIVMLQLERSAVLSLTRLGPQVSAIEIDRDVFRAYDEQGGMSWDTALDRFSSWGSWQAVPSASPRAAISFARCFFNCVAPKLSLAVIKKTVKTIGTLFKIDSCFTCGLSKGRNLEACAKCENAIKPLLFVDGIPILGETIDVTKCAAGCAGQQGVVFPCRDDLLTCDSSVARGVWSNALEQCSYRRIPCENYVLVPEKSYVVNSGLFTDFAKCVEGKGCVRCPGGSRGGGGADEPRAEICDVRRSTVRVARDPNQKVASQAAILAGEEIEYRIDYENEGGGTAYDVFVVDELDPALDESTLDLGGEGKLLTDARTILWSVGDLAPKGAVGSSGSRHFRIRVRDDLPAGTTIANSAVVHFPSVPEETRTNAVVSVVGSLVAESQRVETNVGRSVDLVLAGRPGDGVALEYRITKGPYEGTLVGIPPRLRYTPPPNFVGEDRFSFTVGDGTRTSRTAEVVVDVLPGPEDTEAPTIVWTYPTAGAVLKDVPTEPAYTDENGPAYLPVLRAGASEALAPQTLGIATVRLTGPDGASVPATVSWDGTADAIVVIPRVPWSAGRHTLTIADTVTDASGNSLGAPFVWSFRIGTAGCAGDCNDDGQVVIGELVVGVNIALGNAEAETCPAIDTDGNREVSIAELVAAVNRALSGCAPAGD